MANPLPIDLHPLALRSSSGAGSGVDIGAARSAVALEMVATTVTSSIALHIETSPDGATGWRPLEGVVTLTAPGAARVWLVGCDQWVRVAWTLDGGASATFAVAGVAYTVYATREDLDDALPSDVIEQAKNEDPYRIARALIKGASHCEARVGGAHDLPLSQWQPVLNEANAALAAHLVLLKHKLHGGGHEELVQAAIERADMWLDKVQQEKVVLPNTVPAQDLGPRFSSGDPDNPNAEPDSFALDFQRGAF